MDGLDVARFWSRVTVTKPTDCWEWQGWKDALGYGQFKLDGATKRTHRVAVQAMGIQLTADDVVMHTCDNPCCCNPGHLVVGTHATNVADRVAKSRSAKGSANGRSLLDEAKVRLIKQDNRRLFEIAKDYGVSASTISLIRRGRIWRHV